MVVAVAMMLGIDVWIVVGAVAAVLWSRRRVVAAPGVFKCKARRASGEVPSIRDRWPRRARYARWVHDMLLVHRGTTLVRCVALPVANCTAVSGGAPAEVNGFGDDPCVVELHLDGGAIVELAGAGGCPARRSLRALGAMSIATAASLDRPTAMQS